MEEVEEDDDDEGKGWRILLPNWWRYEKCVRVCVGGGGKGASKSECVNVIVSKLSYVGEGYPDRLLTFSWAAIQK